MRKIKEIIIVPMVYKKKIKNRLNKLLIVHTFRNN